MAKINFKPGNMLYPLPAVLVSCGNIDASPNILTIAWAGTICTNPPMVSISVRPERYSYPLIKESGEFVINLTTKKLAYATDYCGVKSGRDVDKWKECHLTKIPADTISCPMIAESPVNIECQVTEIKELGSHHMFLAKVTAVHVDDNYMDEKNTFHLNDSDLITYSHGTYFTLGNALGTFGGSIRKKGKQTKAGRNKKSQKKPKHN
ncbi:MAG: flavin reductase family protein [Lachnospiraceae bacterium]|jgi:flavin reductase (DIM6/NTAB) family NADH-FMN oxidoreductase RutF|nr:flavin reductase family protein [Lachnospiraceae bacterium]